MDLKSFSDDDFDAKKWINKAWSSSGNQDKEVFVANTVSRLQLYMKQLTNSLDETTTQIVGSIPHVLQEASTLQVEGSLLQQRLLSLEQKVLNVEEETGHSIASLQRIDQLKSRLENAASALREADKWAALATALDDTLEAGVPTQCDKLAELASQVAAMTASLEVLNEAPDYEEKRLQLETLYNRLEAAVSAPLVDALSTMHAERTSAYVSLFAAMGRSLSLARCWRRVAATATANTWRRLDTHSLPALRATLSSSSHTQVEWLSGVLRSETPLSELVRLYTDLLLSLEPSPNKILSANLKLCSTPQEGLLYLTDMRSELDQFVETFSTLLHSQRQTKEIVQPSAIKELGKAVYAPLRELLPRYSELQTQALLAHLEGKELQQTELLECSRSFQTTVERSEGWLGTSRAAAKKIAGRAVYPFYLPAVEAFSSALTSKISSHARLIEDEFLANINSSGVLSNTFPAALALGAAVGALLDILAALLNSVHEELKAEAPKPQTPLHDTESHLLDDAARRLASLSADASPLGSAGELRRAGATLRSLAVNVLREPVHRQLDKIPTLPVWSNNDALSTELPDYALSPQEYITEVGQYLMTLPQHLEMHLSDAEKQTPWQFLTEVCNHTCDLYAEKILSIRNMDALGTRRCLTDIARPVHSHLHPTRPSDLHAKTERHFVSGSRSVYLSSVVEDLGSAITPALKNLEQSLRAATPAPAQN